MTARYAKAGDNWGISSNCELTPGTDVTVEKRNGECKRERVGAFIEYNRYGDYVYQIVRDAPAAAAVIGDLSGILALFDSAKKHLKRPAIVLGLPHPQNYDVLAGKIRINVAGDKAKIPGSLTVLDGERDESTGERDWYGRILLNGNYQPSRSASTGQLATRIIDRLREFAADPDGVAKHSAKLTGACCYCNRALEDARSTAVGYGPVCAKRFGRAWGGANVEVVAFRAA